MASRLDILKWHLGFQEFVVQHPRYSEYASCLTLSDEESRSPQAFISKLMSLFVRSKLEPEFDDAIVSVIGDYIEYQLNQPMAAPSLSVEAANSFIRTLFEEGYSTLPSIGEEKASKLYRWFSSRGVCPRDGASAEAQVTINEARQSVNIAHVAPHDVLKCPGLLESIFDPFRLSCAAKYLGAPPTIASIQAWWSFAGRDAAKDAQLFHLDLDDYRFVKFFLYLTDVDEETGPHIFVPRSHRHDAVHAAFSKAEDKDHFLNWYLHQFRKTDEDVVRYFGPPIAILGKAGNNFMVDTSGLHKGSLPLKRDRLVVQVVYTLSPLTSIECPTLSLSAGDLPDLREDFLTPAHLYALRLYIQP